jgi:Phage-related lysozyme (muraminidase)
MKVSERGINLIKSFEGCKLTGYLCPAGVPTVGYGHTGAMDGKPVCKGMKITKTKAVELLKEDLEKFEKKVCKYPKYKWTQNEFDALVSFAYNVGNIDKLTAGGTRSKAVIAEKILAYNKANGKELVGLTRRRKAEQALFLTV